MTPELKKFIAVNNNWSLKKSVSKIGKLIFIYCNQTQIIAENKPFAILNKMKKELINQPQYKGGVLKITY